MLSCAYGLSGWDTQQTERTRSLWDNIDGP
jgi:hypothetical protein